MKTQLKILAMMVATSLAAGGAVTAGPAAVARPAQNTPIAAALAIAPLTAEESASLLWMREEEKLARDVYLGLDDRWADRTFSKIAKSEQRHFDAIGAKIALFGLADPALPVVGTFSDAELQLLYDQSMATGNISLVQALTAGATIEERDIVDLTGAMAATANAVLLQTYGHLLEGSKNHLRAFVGRLDVLGIDYAPQYLDSVVFDAIVGQ